MAKLTKEEKAALKAERKKAGKGIVADFKAFITRGNVLDMAVGVIMAGAFSAIITGVINGILMPLINSLTGGGLNGLRTPLRWACIPAEAGVETDLFFENQYWSKYIYIDWSLVINAVINFLAIALVLFIVVRVVARVTQYREYVEKKALEAYYEKHPEERPTPAPEAPKAPTQEELLASILAELKKQNAKE